MRVRGDYFDGVSSRRHAAELEFSDTTREVSVIVDDARVALACAVADVRVSPRLGQSPRTVRLPNGARFVSGEIEALDVLAQRDGRGRMQRWVHGLEQGWPFVAGVLLVAVMIGAVVVYRGVPLVAEVVARALPSELVTTVGQRGLASLDETAFEPSALTEARRADLAKRFEELVRWADVTPTPTLEFRKSPLIGANALALPSGIVVLTDELVELTEDPDEVMGVLAHEVGHVAHRHALRQLLQNSLVAVIGLAIVGDVSGIVALLPAMLFEASHSRAFEREADDYAAAYLEAIGVGAEPFVRMLQALERRDEEEGPAAFLSSHPSTEDRTERLRARGRSGLRL